MDSRLPLPRAEQSEEESGKAGQILTRITVDVSEILGKSTFSLSHSTPQTPEKLKTKNL